MDSSKDVGISMTRKSNPRFLDLPVKVRLAIYRILLIQCDPFTPLHHPQRRIKDYLVSNVTRKMLRRAGVQLLRTCKKISEEATSVLYGENSFSLRPDDIEGIPKFFDLIGGSNCSKISSLNINFEYDQERRWRGRWCQQCGADFPLTTREELFQLVGGNQFLTQYPTAKEVSFADQDTIRDSIPRHLELCLYREDEVSLYQGLDVLESEDLYDGYPSWGHRWAYDSRDSRSPTTIFKAIDSLTQCYNLRRLELWFPDPQRFSLGYGCLREDRMFLRRLWPISGISELIIHGIDELGIVESAIERMEIPRVIAELNCSRARPFLHIEAGRPNLRANAHWGVTRSNRFTLTFELRRGKAVLRDRFSSLPAEVRMSIYEYLFPCWYEDFHARSHCEPDDPQPPMIFLEDHSLGCHQTKTRRKHLAGAAALLRVSRLLHEDAAATLYGQYTFSTTPPFGRSQACCPQTAGPSFSPNLALLIDFLLHIGPKNRKRLRHLYIGLHSFIPFATGTKRLDTTELSEGQTLGHDSRFCLPLCTRDFHWKIPKLLMLMKEIPVLDTLALRFCDGVTEAYSEVHRHESEDFSDSEPAGKYMPDANYYLNLFSDLTHVKHVQIAGCLGMGDSELFARLVGAETIAVRRHEERPRMVYSRQALDGLPEKEAIVEAQAKAWGWSEDDGDGWRKYFVKRLTPNNMTPAVSRRLWAVRGMEEDMALMSISAEELDIYHQ